MTEREACVALNLLPGLGPVKVRRLLERFGSASGILSAGASDLAGVPGVGPALVKSIRDWKNLTDVGGELAHAKAAGARVLTLADGEYPSELREIHDPPTVLYIRGQLTAADARAIAVVGTRQPSFYGAETAKKLSYQLAYAGVTIVSGLARGVDTAAHQAALAAHGRTIAVIGSGLSRLYPPENAELADRIASQGAVISEFPMETGADRQTFPMRNRIVSGMTFGILVVEAGTTSGALITANQAADQGRSIYAVPGRIDSPKSIGSNRLIQQGAKLVTCAQDVLDDFGLLFRDQPDREKRPEPAGLAENEAKVFAAIGDDEVSVDEVVGRSGLPTREVSSTLLALELKRLVKPLPGGRVVKTQ
ncbi:MAG: DNA-processing protein DprA [Terrimicrobiaceae bacterium]